MSITLQADPTAPQGYILVNGTTAATVNASGNLTTTSLNTGNAVTTSLSATSLSAAVVTTPVVYASSVVNGSPLMFRNRLINGDMRIDQRAAGGAYANPNGQYTFGSVDRWGLYSTGSILSAQRVSGSTLGTQYAVALSGATGNTTAQILQRIEATNCYDLAGQTATLSFRAYANQTITGQTVIAAATAVDTWANQVNLSAPVITLTTIPTTYSFTFTVPSTATNGLVIYPFLGPLTSGQAAYFTNVQLELGPVATPFEVRPIAAELTLCQRYYTTGGFGADWDGNPWNGGAITFYPPMRVGPSISSVYISGTNSNFYTGAGINGISVIFTTPNTFTWQITRTAAGRAYVWGTISFTAEL